MSPTEAATRAKVSRRTIMRAIEAHELQASRDNRNRWNITPEDLDNWAGAHAPPSGHVLSNAHADAHAGTAQELAAAQLTIARLETRLEERAALLAAAEARAGAAELDRDCWRAMAETLAAPSHPHPRRRWWRW